jgi:FkbM family methyltransferase
VVAVSSLLRFVMEVAPRSFRDRAYGYAKRYVDHCEGNNNPDIKTNGELRFLRTTIAQCKVVFDVGANVGEWANLVLQINPAVQLHCFEPSKSTFAKLAVQHFPANIVINNFGLSSTSRQAKLFVFGEGNGMNSLHRRQGLEYLGLAPQEREETIELQTLDEYCSKHDVVKIDYLKLDVEGHELEVLRGAENALNDGRIGMAQFEYGGCNIDSRVLLKDIFDFVQSLPYVVCKILPESIQQLSGYSQALETFQYSNWLLIHKDV